jgi:rsbT antagonist protein RsbS
MDVPILQQGDVLIASVQSDLSDMQVTRLRDELTRLVGSSRATGVVVNVSGMDVIDSFTARLLRSIAESARLRGATTYVVGIRPEVAIALVHFDVDLAPLQTALDLEEAMRLLGQRRDRHASDAD